MPRSLNLSQFLGTKGGIPPCMYAKKHEDYDRPWQNYTEPACGYPSYMCFVKTGYRFIFFCKRCFVRFCGDKTRLKNEEDYFPVSDLTTKLKEYRKIHLEVTKDPSDANEFLATLPSDVEIVCGCGKDATRVSLGWHDLDEPSKLISWCDTCHIHISFPSGGDSSEGIGIYELCELASEFDDTPERTWRNGEWVIPEKSVKEDASKTPWKLGKKLL